MSSLLDRGKRMGRSRRRDEEPLSVEDTEALAAITSVAEETRAENAHANGQHHSPDWERALRELLGYPQLADVTWCLTAKVPNHIAGSLTIPAEPELQPMTPERARTELTELGRYLNGGAPATERTVQEGKRTRVIVSGRLHGAEVELAVLMPPMDPLTATAPATTAWEPVDAAPATSEGASHPYVSPMFGKPRRVAAAEEETGDAA